MKIKILLLLFLSLSLYGEKPYKIEKVYGDYKKYSKNECRFKSKIIYYYKNNFFKKTEKFEYRDMLYICYHGLIYFSPMDTFVYTQTPTQCRCEDDKVWIRKEGYIEFEK